jgi:hypothetical protein
MKRPDLSEDEILATILSDAIDHLDPVSTRAVEAAVAACDIGYADAELAALVADSMADAGVLLRDELDSTVLTFRSSRVTVELEIDRDLHAIGLISPPAATEVVVETAATPGAAASSRTWSARTDELGRFRIDVDAGLCRLRIGSGSETTVTSWFHC